MSEPRGRSVTMADVAAVSHQTVPRVVNGDSNVRAETAQRVSEAIRELGYRRVLLAPRPGGGITWASTSLETVHGRVSSHWRLDGDVITLDVELPDGVTGVLRLPGRPDAEVTGKATISGIGAR